MFGGPEWYAFFDAPPPVVASARAGTMLAPVASLIIAGLMALCAAYAVSALGLIRALPLPRFMLGGMAGVCLLRALIWLPLAIVDPELRTTFQVVAATVWGLAGVGFAIAFRNAGNLTPATANGKTAASSPTA